MMDCAWMQDGVHMAGQLLVHGELPFNTWDSGNLGHAAHPTVEGQGGLSNPTWVAPPTTKQAYPWHTLRTPKRKDKHG